MAELTTLARPYARAAFEVAAADEALEQWSRTLETLSAVVAEEKVSNLLKSPSLTAEKQAGALIDICGEHIVDKSANMIRLLAENRRLLLLPQIAELFAELRDDHEKTVDVELSTAFELSQSVIDQLTAALEKRLDRQIKLHTRVETDLIGGAVIRAGDTVIDNSVRGKLKKLAESMNS